MITNVLVILDGWGISSKVKDNAIAMGRTPHYDYFLETYPWCRLEASGAHVGLPEGQMGNSEVGHLNIGAGRVVPQVLTRLNHIFLQKKAIDKYPAFQHLFKDHATPCHLIGLLSDGGVHSHQTHLEALYDALIDKGIQVKFHAILDGRDTPPQSAVKYIERFTEGGQRSIQTISGRFYAMDRDQRWDRTQQAYRAIAEGQAPKFSCAIEYVRSCYHQAVSDEFIPPAVLGSYKGIAGGESIFMGNFRSDRARQMLRPFLDPFFDRFPFTQRREKEVRIVGMIDYFNGSYENLEVLFSSYDIKNTLGEWISLHTKKQLRVAETEKYAHVTYFMNGGKEEKAEGEEWMLVPSPSVKTYDLMPEMAASQVTQKVIDAIGKYDLIVVNYANPDMVGHTGDLDASIKAVEHIDQQLNMLYQHVKKNQGSMIITADHGNIEKMKDKKNSVPYTAHTTNPVPMILVSADKRIKRLENGGLCDVAPTLLKMMKLNQPQEMTGQCLIKF